MCAHLWRPLTQKSLLVSQPRYLSLNLCVNQIDDGHFSQYYGIAAGIILFYDPLLTLDDEVRFVMHLKVTPLIALHFEDQIYLVWKEIPGCARRLKVMASSANLIFGQCFGFSLLSVSSAALRSLCSLTGVSEPVLSDDVSGFSACASVLCLPTWTPGRS